MSALIALLTVAVVASVVIIGIGLGREWIKQYLQRRAEREEEAKKCQHFWAPWSNPDDLGYQSRICNKCNHWENQKVTTS